MGSSTSFLRTFSSGYRIPEHAPRWVHTYFELHQSVYKNDVLNWAVQHNEMPTIVHMHTQQLLTKADVQGSNNRALSLAAKCGHASMIKFLKEKWQLEYSDAVEAKALYHAVQGGHVCVVKLLHKLFGFSAADVTTADLSIAAIEGYTDTLQCLQEDYGVTANQVRQDDNVVLRVAAKKGQAVFLQCLQKLFGLTTQDAQSMDNWALQSALHWQHLDVVRILAVDYGLSHADTLWADGNATQLAAKHGRIDILECLRKHYGTLRDDILAVGFDGWNALDTALVYNHYDTLIYLYHTWSVGRADISARALGEASYPYHLEARQYVDTLTETL